MANRLSFHSGIVVALAIAGFVGGASAQPAPSPPPGPPPGGDHVVRFTNGAKTAISAIYVAPSGSKDMSDDLLGKQTANAGKTVTLKIKDSGAGCTFDLQLLMTDGHLVDRKGVNVCQSADYAFTP